MTPAVDKGMRRQEVGAQAIGLLEVLLEDGDIPSPAVRKIAERIVAEWEATLHQVAA